MKLDLPERIMHVFVFIFFLLLTGRPPITGATASGRGCPAATRRGAWPWSPPRKRGTAPSATTTPRGTTTGSGPARAARPFSKGAFKVITCSSESPLLFTLEEAEIPARVWDNDIYWVFISSCALPYSFISVLGECF